MHGVIPPDESSGVVNDSIYTNAAAAATLQWCVEAAGELGLSDTIPPLWSVMSASPYLPLTAALSPNGTVHEEYTGYNGHAINQADVALLQYPLGLPMDPALARRDLGFWASKTNFAGMFTGDASYSVAYLGLGDRASADAQTAIAFTHMDRHFNAFMEKADGSGTQHFITGAGGYLQVFVFGYSGLRVDQPCVLSFRNQRPVLPPLGVSAVKLRGLHLDGQILDVTYDANTTCVRLQEQPQQQQQQAARDSGSKFSGQRGTDRDQHVVGGLLADGDEVCVDGSDALPVLVLRSAEGSFKLSSTADVCVATAAMDVACWWADAAE
jgi:trehalose/maltose hydrolase-like predicted phosphorylase